MFGHLARRDEPCGCYQESSGWFTRLHFCDAHAEAIGREAGVRPREVRVDSGWVEAMCAHIEAQMGGANGKTT